MTGFAEVCARSCFSLLDGASTPLELVSMARAQGHAGFGLCDANSLAGVVRAHKAAKEMGLPFAPGARLLLSDGSTYLAWPTDRASYGRLTRLLSEARMAAPRDQARIDPDAMRGAAEGWVLAACPPAGLPGADFAARLRADAVALRNRLALPLLCVARRTLAAEDQARIDRLARIAAAAGAGLLASTDPRYHHPDRRALADVMTAIRLGTTVDALGFAAEPNAERHLKSLPQMRALFRHHPEALANSLRVLAATRGFSLDQLRYEYPHEVLEPGRTAQETLESRVRAAMRQRWPLGASDDLRRRVREELALIQTLGYAPYFLTVHEIVLFARSKEILCQGRGSAANSAVCYVLNITAVDPDKIDLLFDRFVSASRDEPPDIDVDFEHDRREDVIQHIYERYGRARAAICATIIHYRPRSAVREVGKAMGLSADVTGKLAAAAWGPGREESLVDLARAEGLDPTEPRLAMILHLAQEMVGMPRHLATHVGGFVITSGPLVELAVVTRAAMEGRTVLEWDKEDIDTLGILKVDVLGLGMLSCLRRAFDLLDRHKKQRLALESIEQDCSETYKMLRRADSIGVFQVESRAQMNMLPRLKPKEFYDLVIQVAIVRPGPIQGDMVHPYLSRRDKVEAVHYPGPAEGKGNPDELRDILEKTLGVPLFQEQVMRLAMVAAGFTGGEADQLRRHMGRFDGRGSLNPYGEKLIQGMVSRGYSQDFAERIFRQIQGFGSYGFPESHAASFAHLVYASAWLKRHHPGIFACALLNSQPMGFYAPAQIVRDARAHQVTVLPVDANESDWDCTMDADPASADGLSLRLGLRLTSGLSPKEAEALTAARALGNGAPFASIEEMARRTGLGRRPLAAIAATDAFQGMGLQRREALWEAQAVEPAALPLFDAAESLPLLPEPAPSLPGLREGEAVVADYGATGLTLRRHPLALLRPELDRLGCADTRRLDAAPGGTRLRLAGLVLMRQRPGTSKGVIFMTLEDEHGVGNLVVYAGIAARDRRAMIGSRLLLAEGRVERAPGQTEIPVVHLIVQRLVDRTDLLGLLRQEAGEVAGGADPARALPPSRDFR
jgi:error-prone DNA polymerase